MKKLTQRLPLVLLILIWGGLAVVCWFKPTDQFSVSERRKLAELPEFSAKSIVSGKYFREFETYTLDQFPLRDEFRTLKSVSELGLFQKKDNHDIYLADGYAAKMEYPLKEVSVQNAVKKLNALYERYLKEDAGKIYLSVIPDKGYYMAQMTDHLAMDYKKLFQQVREGMEYAQYIDVTSVLELSDYYKTDSHWRQEKITDAAEMFADTMGIELSGQYEEHVVEKPFYGVYYGQSALPLQPDTIRYLSNDILKDCTVYNEEKRETTGLYDPEKLESRDMYEVYLSGASALLTIENPHVREKKELVVFRDSFASSLIPLLAEGYSKITLIDTRYIQPALLGEYVDFTDADVLFLYSTTVLNNSQTLR